MIRTDRVYWCVCTPCSLRGLRIEGYIYYLLKSIVQSDIYLYLEGVSEGESESESESDREEMSKECITRSIGRDWIY